MGFSFGPKTLGIALLALTGGDKGKADRLMADIGEKYADTWEDVYDYVADWLEKDAAGE